MTQCLVQRRVAVLVGDVQVRALTDQKLGEREIFFLIRGSDGFDLYCRRAFIDFLGETVF